MTSRSITRLTDDSLRTLAQMRRDYRPDPLEVWSGQLESDLTHALRLLPGFLPEMTGPFDSYGAALRMWFGMNEQSHPFYQQVEPWLRLTETQVVGGLAHYMRRHGTPAMLAFLDAIAPCDWPANLLDLRADVEVMVPGRGRIDLLVSGILEGRKIGVVVEAKWGSDLRNSLKHYKRHVLHNAEMRMCPKRTKFIVLGANAGRKTARKLGQNQCWSSVSWREFLRRFEIALNRQGVVDPGFAVHRQRIWSFLCTQT